MSSTTMTDDGGQLRPLRLQARLAFDLLALGDLFEVGVDLRPLGVRQLELRQSAFVKTTPPPPPTRSLARRPARSAAPGRDPGAAEHQISASEGDAGIMRSLQKALSYIILEWTDIMVPVVRTQISLTEAQMDRLRREARRRHTSIAAIIRDAVDATVIDEEADRLTRQRRAFGVAGSFSSGRSDTSDRHDDLLDEETRW